jgi:hypothetical protein
VQLKPATALRGQEVFIDLDLPGADAVPKELKVWLGNHAAQNPVYAGKAVSFTVPQFTPTKAKFPLGKYPVIVWLDKRQYEAGEITVAASIQGRPEVTGVVPKVAELEIENRMDFFGGGKGAWTILGRNFAENSRDDIKLLVNGVQHDVIWGDSCEPKTILDKSKVYGVVRNSNELQVCNVPIAEQGQLSLAIRQGIDTAEGPLVTATRWPRMTVLLASLLLTVAIVLLAARVLASVRAVKIGNQEYKFRALLLDSQTKTYSLSIFQFILWTTAGGFGYIYLALSRMFVQRGDIPDVPGTLPAIVGIGLGAVTGVAAQVINSAWPKGAGDERPSPSDLLTSGGSIAPDRVQMFFWTIIGVLGFLAGVIRQNPASMQSLPPIPDTLMALMGLSSAGYLGAKFARKPGPNIQELSVMPQAAGTAGSAPAPAVAPDVSGPLSAAARALQSVKAAVAGLPASGNAPAVRAANDAVAALEAGVAAAAAAGKPGQSAANPAWNELTGKAYDAAVRAAGEFDALGGAAGSETARLGSAIAQNASAALEALAKDVDETVKAAEAVDSKRRKEIERGFRRVIELRGANLASDGTFRVKVDQNNEPELPFRMLAQDGDGRRKPEIVEPEPDSTTLARTLRLTIVPSELDPVDRITYDKIFGKPGQEITVAIFNRDGQRSSKTFKFPA